MAINNNSSNSLRRTIIVVIALLIGTYFLQQIRTTNTATPTDSTSNTTIPEATPVESDSPPSPNSPQDSPNSTSPQPQRPGKPKQPAEEGNELNRQLSSQRIYYTKHARCRMDCRHISEAEVLEVLQRGKENRRKSEPNAPDCPKYALEGVTKDGQKVRMIFADCNNETRVITVIDLNNEHQCDCD